MKVRSWVKSRANVVFMGATLLGMPPQRCTPVELPGGSGGSAGQGATAGTGNTAGGGGTSGETNGGASAAGSPDDGGGVAGVAGSVESGGGGGPVGGTATEGGGGSDDGGDSAGGGVGGDGAGGAASGGEPAVSCPAGSSAVVGKSGCFECPLFTMPPMDAACGVLSSAADNPHYDPLTHKLYVRIADGLPVPNANSGFALVNGYGFGYEFECNAYPIHSVEGDNVVLDLSPYFACPQPPEYFEFLSFVEHHSCDTGPYPLGLDSATNLALYFDGAEWVLSRTCFASQQELPIEFGNYVPYPQPARYDVSNPLAVKDNVSGLSWEHHPSSANFRGTQYDALTYCEELSYGGFSDWRLPTAPELFSLMKLEKGDYAFLDPVAFPNNYASMVWSSTPWSLDPTAFLLVTDFVTNTSIQWDEPSVILADAPEVEYDVRCVRGGTPPVTRYTDNGNGTVRDNRTGLVWEKAPTVSNVTPRAAQSYCRNLGLAGGGWRVPTINELVTLADNLGGYPTIDPVFTGASALPSVLWSSTRYQSSYPDTSAGWYLSANGSPRFALPELYYVELPGDVRCVR